MAGLCIAVRIAAMLYSKAYLFAPRFFMGPDSSLWDWEFGMEMGRVARSITLGHGFGSPFHGWTGPTAWQPPLYPYLLAGIFRVFGLYTPASGFVSLLLNCIAAALTCLMIFRIADKIVGRKAALWSSFLWAVLPATLEHSVFWAWETSITTFLLALAIWMTLRLPDENAAAPWLRLGALWGVIALLNPALLSILPCNVAWAWWYNSARRRTPYAAVTLLAVFLFTLPWNIRDRVVMGHWMFLRDNFWAEVSYGNSDVARGIWVGWLHPGSETAELKRYATQGEIRYIAGKKREVLAFIRRNPSYFANLTLRHALLFWSDPITDLSDDLQPDTILYHHSDSICFSALAWVGLFLMLRRSPRYSLLFAPAFVVYPCLYYITSADPRYRHPILPFMMILATYAVMTAAAEHNRKHQQREDRRAMELQAR